MAAVISLVEVSEGKSYSLGTGHLPFFNDQKDFYGAFRVKPESTINSILALAKSAKMQDLESAQFCITLDATRQIFISLVPADNQGVLYSLICPVQTPGTTISVYAPMVVWFQD